MIIYPSENFAKGQELSKKKLNTYFELTESKVPNVKDSLFSEDGVTAYIDDENNEETYEYVILPLVDYICFEVFNGESNSIEVKKLITQWREYVQAARSHNSLYADVCSWKNVSFELNDEQRKIKDKIEALVLTDELCELDDIVRVLCGLSVNKAPETLSPFELANTIASNYIDIAKNRSAQTKLSKIEVEVSMLQEKNDKLSSDLSASQSVIAKKNEQLQDAQQQNDSLKEDTLKLTTSFEAKLEKAGQQAAQLNEEINALNQNNLKKVAELEALVQEKVRLKESFEKEKNENRKIAEALEHAKQQVSELNNEIELCQLQIAQLQEELEAVCNDKVKDEKAFEEKLKDAEKQLKHATATTSDNDELQITLAENELMQLQILQLQEELEFYFKKASSTKTTVASTVLEKEIFTDDVATAATQKDNTLSLIGRLMNASGRGNN